MLAVTKPTLFFLGIDRFDAHTFAGLLHFDLNFLREGFCFLMRAGLSEYGCGNLDVAAGLAVELDASELVLDAHRLACTELHRLLKIPRHLILRGSCGVHGPRGEKQ